MQHNHTDITVVIDRSGSMASIKSDVIGGFNNFLAEQKKAEGRATLTLNQFDDIFETVFQGVNIQMVSDLNDKNYVPRNMTALLDAVGRSINDTGKRLDYLTDSEKPNKVVFLIITDGLENASKEFTFGKVKTMVEHQRDKYNWQFIFIGANIDAYAQGSLLGAQAINTMTFASNREGTRSAFTSLSSKVSDYRKFGATSDALAFNDADYKAQAEAGVSQTSGGSK